MAPMTQHEGPEPCHYDRDQPSPFDQVAAARQELLDHGYRDIGHIRTLRVGRRVRLGSERYSEALRRGTGVIAALLEKSPSPWGVEWGRRDIELVVLRDLDRRSSSLTYRFGAVARVADYHVVPVDECYWCHTQVDQHGGCECRPRTAEELGQ